MKTVDFLHFPFWILFLQEFPQESSSIDAHIIYQWNLVDFNFPYDYDLRNSFRPENTVFTGFEMTDDRIFLTMPRLRSGVPATLATINRKTLVRGPNSGPELQPYPNWAFHDIRTGFNNCSGLVSVYRIRKDACNRLWVLDSGIMTSLEDFRRMCPPKIVIFDLATDLVVRSIIFPRQVLRPNSLLTNLIIDESVQGTCDSAFVYMSDTAAPGLVVYNGAKDTAWRLMHPSMFPDPDYSDYTIADERFTLMDGIVGLAHAPKLATLFFQPLATNRIFSVSTFELQKGPLPAGEALPITLVGKKSSQGIGMALNARENTLYFSPVTETSLASWNPVTNHQKLVLYDAQALQFVAEIRWFEQDNSIWLLSTRFQKFFRGTIRPDEINLRLIRIKNANLPIAGLNTNNNNNNIYFNSK